ncbi:Methyltransferase type 12 [Rippkaea orientalis PCC 8801]|uniref:Methyltransferase type 12 n=2 Tax=Rippkaea TaxID=2546365 RepID=B7K376_RIPO1|nr:Methyltransferase type 12 [Rippkaea orientalis PCC 8801]
MKCLICNLTSLRYVGQNPSFKKGKIYRCKQCQLAMTHPLPTVKELLEFYQSGYYIKTITKEAIEQRLLASQQRASSQFEFIRQYLPENTTLGKVLDLGCSDGSLLLLLDKHGFDVWGYEPDTQMAELANKRLSKDQEKVSNDMFPGKEVEKNTYDLICSSHLFEHIVDPITHLEQIRESLTVNGLLFMEIPNQYSRLKDFLCPGAQMLGHLYYYSPHSIKCILENHGFKVIYITTCGINIKNFRKPYGKSSIEIQIDNLIVSLLKIVSKGHLIKKLYDKIEKKVLQLNKLYLSKETTTHEVQSPYTTYWEGNEQGNAIRLIAKKMI